MKLGRQAPRRDARTLRLARYLDRSVLPPAPPVLDLGAGAMSWPMLGNDRAGDCTFAAAGHMVELWTDRATGAPAEVRTADILQAYSEVSGYDPTTGADDVGAVELDVLNYWRTKGIAGHKIEAFTAVDYLDLDLLRIATALFGGLYVGLSLPKCAQGADTWILEDARLRGDAAPGSWGGHAVNVVGYDAQGMVVVTWGRLQKMSWAFWFAYGEEAFALLSPDWLTSRGVSPGGLDITALRADLASVTM